MAKPQSIAIFSHWHTMLEGLAASPQSFYGELESALDRRQVPGATLGRIDQKEGGVFSARREYLEVRRGRLIFHICGAPFGNGFFVSWWLGETQSRLAALLAALPWVGPVLSRLFRPVTYYRLDTALMFQSLTHSAVLEVIDALSESKGLRGLSERERRPSLRELVAA